MTTDAFDALAATLPDAAAAELRALDSSIRRLAPSLARRVAEHGLVAYGWYRYRYATGREGEVGVISLAARKAGITMYVGPTYVERFASRLPAADCGKGCIRMKRASDLPDDVLADILAAVVPADGKLVDWTGVTPQDGPAFR
jgi:hypothetical protein